MNAEIESADKGALNTADFYRKMLGIVKDEELKEISESDNWLIPRIVCTTNTLIYGQASAGKSMVVASIIASLHDGRELFGVQPLHSGLRGLVICSDTKSEYEYSQRLKNIGATGAVEYMPDAGIIDSNTWEKVASFVKAAGFDYVIIDHATGVVDGDAISREPWQKFWQNAVGSLGLPTIVVAHASDSTYQGQTSHRPMGNSAVAQFSRCEVEVHIPGGAKFGTSPLRELRTKSRYGDGVTHRFRIADPGVIVPETATTGTSKHQRNKETYDINREIARLASQSRSKTKTAVAREIATKVGLSAGTIRNRFTSLVSSNLLKEQANAGGGIFSAGDKLKK